MGHVLKADLAGGRLLELDQDLPDLLTAAEVASTSLRDLIGDLRKSTLGRRGLETALVSLIRALSRETSAVLHVDIGSVRADPASELAIYQIAKEAVGNALVHARPKNVWVSLREEADELMLTVRDDGVGFDPYTEPAGHYGIAIMRERTTLLGGLLVIDSCPGLGCTLNVTLPGGGTRDHS